MHIYVLLDAAVSVTFPDSISPQYICDNGNYIYVIPEYIWLFYQFVRTIRAVNKISRFHSLLCCIEVSGCLSNNMYKQQMRSHITFDPSLRRL